MDSEITVTEQELSVSDVEVLQGNTLLPSVAQIVTTSHNEDFNAFISPVAQSSETEIDPNPVISISQIASATTKSNDEVDSYISKPTSSAAKENQNDGQSTSETPEINKEVSQSVSTATTKTNQGLAQATSLTTEENQGTSQSDSSTTETNQDAVKSTSGSSKTNQSSCQPILFVDETYQDTGQSLSHTHTSATKTNHNTDQTTSSTAHTNSNTGTIATELILPASYMNEDITQENTIALDIPQSTINDHSLPVNPPDYHDIIPLIEDESNVLPPPPSTFKSLCCCLFGAYRLYYARQIRNSGYMVILLVAILALPVSAIYMGLKYYDSCSVTPRTPLLLVLMGVVGVLMTFLRILTIVSRSFKDLGVCEPPRIIIESSVGFIFCLIVAEMITFYQNIPVFDDPKNPLYCAELFHTYIFYMNFVVPTVGILALLLHLPMKPVNNTTRRLQEAARSALRRQENMEPSPSQVYTAWIKPRRRRSRRNEENAEISASRFRVNEGTDNHDSRTSNPEESTFSSNQTEETTIGGTAGNLQRDEGDVSRGNRIHWWDEEGIVREDIRNPPWDREKAIGGEMCAEEGAIGGPTSSQITDEGSVGGAVEDEEGAVGGAVGGHLADEGVIGGAVGGHWVDEEGAVGGNVGGHQWDEDGAEFHRIEPLQWDKNRSFDSHRRNIDSHTFRSRHLERVLESTACTSRQIIVENSEVGISGSRRTNDESGASRSLKWDVSIECGAKPKTKETSEGDHRRKRNESVSDYVSPWLTKKDEEDINPLLSENVETEVRHFHTESIAKSDTGTRWSEYGARPKIKKNVERVSRTKHTQKTTPEERERAKLKVSSEMADTFIRNTEDPERNIKDEGGVRLKEKMILTRHKNKPDAEGGTVSKQIETPEAGMEEDAKSGKNSERKVKTQVEIKEAEGSAFSKSDESEKVTESDASPTTAKLIHPSDRIKEKMTKDNRNQKEREK